ncbi:enoyl-CoA hydratase-related protein [Pyruvatibacter sp.]|uniref:enoyl-CoA hydratase/isomerase family protein n=1 Tax=Pyruvatibacter sp. TaxID=1981328 RepID=UPI0032EBEFDB
MSEHAPLIIETPATYIRRIRLNRPKQMNAYTTQMCDAMCDELDAYLKDDDLRVLIVTGEGRGFCAGGDVSNADTDRAHLMSQQLSHAREMRDGMHKVIQTLHHLDKPIIAAINGPAVAGGLALALACDFRIAAASAKLGDTSGRFALLPDEGGGWLFPRAMGLDKALQMTLLAETYSADEAMTLGLVTQVVEDDTLEATALELATRLAAQSPLAVRLAKSMMRNGLDLTLEQSQREAALAVMIANPSDDVAEGVKAFFEKRAPVFSGK